MVVEFISLMREYVYLVYEAGSLSVLIEFSYH